MNGPSENIREIQQLLAALDVGELTAPQDARLQQIVAEDEDARRLYLEMMFLIGHLRYTHSQEPLALREGNASIPALPSLLVQPALSLGFLHSALGFLSATTGMAVDWRRHPVRFVAVATVLTGVAWAILFAFVLTGRQDGQRPSADGVFASITTAKQVAWMEGATHLPAGTAIRGGEYLELASGMIEVTCHSGARVVLQGPAKLIINAPGSMTLESGRVLVRVSQQARGFRVETPSVDVVDLGTEFGINVTEKETEIQVFEGKVQAYRHDNARDRGRLLVAGQATVFGNSPQLGFYVKEKKMNRSIYLALAAMLALPASQPADAALITLSASRDTTILGIVPDNNYGGLDYLGVGSVAAARNNSLISFDLTGLPGTNMVVTSATLRVFYHAADTGGTGRTVEIYEAVSANGGWVEGTGVAGDSSGATWNERDASVVPLTPWTGAIGLESVGTAYHSQLLSSQNVLNSTADKTAVDFVLGSGQYSNLTEMTQSWSAGMSGLLLRLPDGASLPAGIDRVAFFSTEDGVAEVLAPQLILTVEEAPVPEPATGAALGIGGMMVLGFTRRRRRRRKAA